MMDLPGRRLTSSAKAARAQHDPSAERSIPQRGYHGRATFPAERASLVLEQAFDYS